MLGISLLLTLASVLYIDATARARDRLRFENVVQRTQVLLQHRMETYVALLRATAALFAVDGDVSEEEFQTFLQRQGLSRRFTGIQGTGFCRQTRPGSCRLVYVEPLNAGNRTVLGYDLFRDPARRSAMERARDSGLPAATSRVSLINDTGPDRQAGFLIFLPVYRGGAPPPGVEERRADLLGFVLSAFRAGSLFQSILPPGEIWNVGYTVYAGAPSEENLLHRSAGLAANDHAPRFEKLGGFEVAGSSWTVAYATLPEFEEGSSRPQVLWLLLMGLGSSAVLFLLARAQVRAEAESARLYEAEHRARDEAETANRAKDRFMAALSHELRTPLTPVLAVLSTLESRLDRGHLPSGELREGLGRIRRNVELEARLIDDLLDLTRISRGKLELKREMADLRDVLEHALETSFGPLPSQERPRLLLDLAAGDHRLWADAPRLTQVFWNLLSNALKFTPPEGEVRLRTWREGPDGLAVEVTDTGIGIEPEALPHVFDAFVQGPRDITRQFGGLGLGLAISKAIVAIHGGSLTVASEGRGRGATFTVRLPAAVHPGAESPAAVAPETRIPKSKIQNPKSVHVLLVEDHPDTAEAMADLLRATGRQVTVAHSVRETLVVAEASQGRFDLVLSDIGLPDGTGHDLMRELRSRYNLPGIALTGYGMEEDVERSREAGFVRHLTKPIHLETLEAAIRQVTETVQ
ncbi:MAG TPA: CHASE domain-containing protein [Thermoanaerobaculia bacterium]